MIGLHQGGTLAAVARLAGYLLLVSIALSACDPVNERSSKGSDAFAGGNDMAALAATTEGFTEAVPGYRLAFPRDHGAHPDFRIEWWYLTANLEDDQGRPHGAQWTLFRIATRPPDAAASLDDSNPWLTGQVFMAHFAVTWPDGHAGFQRYARGGEHRGRAQAGVTAQPFSAWLDDWQMTSTGQSGWLPLEVQARQGQMAVSLQLRSHLAPVLQGDGGFSQKHSQGTGSYYYSHPFLAATGKLVIDGREVPVTGQAWMDHEWSSQFLHPDQQGWDWLALHLDSGEKIMLFRLRQRPGAADTAGQAFSHGVLIHPDGDKTVLEPDGIVFEPLEYALVAGRKLPMNWRITLADINRDLQVSALHPDQWMDVDFAYWEGVVQVSPFDSNVSDRDSQPGSAGMGYLEMTGYPVD